MSLRTVIIAGASGLVGRKMLEGLLVEGADVTVHSLGRKPLTIQHPQLVSHVVDFTALPTLPHADEVYLALGTTIDVAGSQAAFRAVDYEANLAVATAALAAGAKRAGLVSAMGADVNSRAFYSRVKGELENALEHMSFERLVIARPSLLVGNREALGQPTRFGERLGFALANVLGFLIPTNYKPIDAADVARALLSAVPQETGHEVLLSGAMQRQSGRPS